MGNETETVAITPYYPKVSIRARREKARERERARQIPIGIGIGIGIGGLANLRGSTVEVRNRIFSRRIE